MNRKNKVVEKQVFEIRKPNRKSPMQTCPNTSIDDGKFCIDRVSKKKTEKKHTGCEPYEDFSKGMCYPKCKNGYIGYDNRCMKIQKKNQYVEAIKKRQLDLIKENANRSRSRERFSNITSEWLNYNKIDKTLSDLFDDNLKQYRWFFVVCLVIVAYIVIINLLQSPNAEVKPPQQPTIIVQIPSTGLQVPQQVLQPVLQTTSGPVTPQQIVQVPETQISPVKSDIPIKITDLKKGGFNKNIFSDIETSIFSDWNMSD
jgi:hypothetical protein